MHDAQPDSVESSHEAEPARPRTFSFRAECRQDAICGVMALTDEGIPALMQIFSESQFPGVEVELETAAPFKRLEAVLGGIEGGHVMRESLRECPRALNSMVRR